MSVTTGKMEILDQGRAVESTIQGAPVKGLFGELFKNSVEGGATELHATTTDVRGFSVPKAMFIDDGKGIDEATLINLKGIFGKPKKSNGKKETNYNTGARAMTIESNNLGVVFVSKHAGVIRAIRLFKDSEGYQFAYGEDKFIKDYGKDFGFDKTWTAVILLGNDKNQNTYENPYANSPKYPFEQQFIDREYTNRLTFYTEGFVEVKATEDVHGESGMVWTVRPRGAKYQIKYVIGERPMIGILHESELFDLHKMGSKNFFNNNGTYLYGQMAAYPVANELSVIIILDEELNVDKSKKNICQTQYRDALVNCMTREPVEISNFMKHVETRMPRALIEYIDEKRDKEEEVQLKNRAAELSKEFMRKLGLNMEMLKPEVNGDDNIITVDDPDNPTPRGKQGQKGEVKDAKRVKGLTNLVAAWEEKEWDRKDVGYVTGKSKAYFNEDNPVFIEAVKQVIAKKGMANEDKKIIKESLRNMLAESYGLALAWELDEEQSGGVLLNNAMLLLSTGEFALQYVASRTNKKG